MKKTLPAFCALLMSLALAWPAAAELCEKCKDRAYIQTVGECVECGGTASSGAFKLCKGCSSKLGECEHCRAKLGALTAGPTERQAADEPQAATRPTSEPTRIDMANSGTYTSGKWKYVFEIKAKGSRSEGQYGQLFFDGKEVPDAENINDYHETPWGRMYWVGRREVIWGPHGWFPETPFSRTLTRLPHPLAAERARLLKQQIDHFRLRIEYLGPPLPSKFQVLELSVPPMLPKAFPEGHWFAQIDIQQATRIIEHLTSRGFLGPSEQAPPKAPCIILTVEQYRASFGWALPMLERLEALRKVLDGDAAKAMDRLLEALEPQRKKWQEQAPKKPAPATRPATQPARADSPSSRAVIRGSPLFDQVAGRLQPGTYEFGEWKYEYRVIPDPAGSPRHVGVLTFKARTIDQARNYDRVETPWGTCVYFGPAWDSYMGWMPSNLISLTEKELTRGRDLTPADAWPTEYADGAATRPATTRPSSPQATRPGSPQSQPATRPVAEGDRFSIAGREYDVKYLDAPATFGQVQDSRKLFVWHKGKGWLIDPLKPDLKTQFKCDWPVEGISPDLSLAVAMVKRENSRDTDSVAVDLKKNEIIGRMPGLHVSRWFFSSDGRFIFPLSGYSKDGWSYFDVGQGKLVTRKLPDLDWHYWSSAVLEDGKTVLAVVRDGSGEPRRLLTVKLAKPEDFQAVAKVPDDIVQITGRFNEDLLCIALYGRTLLLSCKTWQTRPVSEAQERMLEGRADPSGKCVYWCHSRAGLFIYERKSGKETAFPSRDGWYFNARSFGATFSADGKLAVVATPYNLRVTFIDTATRKVVDRLPTGMANIAPAGAFLIEAEKEGQVGLCLVVGTFLPYE